MLATNTQSNTPVLPVAERAQQVIWESLWAERKRLHVYHNVVQTAKECLGSLPGKKVLEIGCGRGATLIEMGRAGAEITGLDYAQSALDCCETLRAVSGLTTPVEFRCGDARALPFADQSFDFVFSVGLLEHFEQPLTLLREQQRVVRKGGFVFVQVPQTFSPYTLVKKICIGAGKWPYGGWETQFSASQMRAMVQQAGLEITDMYGYGSFWLALLRHFLCPRLDYDIAGRGRGIFRSHKTRTAMDLCVLSQKSGI